MQTNRKKYDIRRIKVYLLPFLHFTFNLKINSVLDTLLEALVN